MCGIAGLVTIAPSAGCNAIVRRMADRIQHRGPDDCGFFGDDFAALGHRRLSIVDVAGGHQPMTNENGSLWITYNGEIFNHAGIRPELERAGHRYASRCDTETILHAYEEWGPESVSRFRGMFAYAIWNGANRTLFCARDRLGIKPLYYFWDGRTFAFASEIKALLAHPAIPAEFEESLLPEYLGFGYVSEERTLFRNIRKLMPGHHLTLDVREPSPRLRIERYWDLPQCSEPPENCIAETRRRLEETVRMRLMADVPLGMFLSGGVDSSAIAALIKRMTDGPVKTFAVGYREAQYSELSYASEVARAIGTEHREVVIGMDDFFEALPRLVWHEDEPITWPSSVSLYFVSKLAAEEVKVVLTGEGSDELFGGYERYRWNMINTRWARRFGIVPASVREGLREQIGGSSFLRASVRRKLGHTFLGRDGSLESLYLDNFYCAFPAGERDTMLRAPGDAYANYRRYWDARPDAPPLPRMLYADQKTYLVELLMKQDQMSMATSIESRVPFLDHQFVEFAMSIPDDLKIHGSTQKYVLKKAVEDLLPREIIYRKKMGFPTPLRQWLVEEKAAPMLDGLTARDGFLAEYLNLEQVTTLLQRHREGLVDATDRIWRLLNLQIWGDVFITGRGSRVTSEPAHSAV